jgi:hypothetical protein
MKDTSEILTVAMIPVALALVAGLQQALLRSRASSPEAIQRALVCDIYRVSWTSWVLGLAMFGNAAFFIMILVSFNNPDNLVFLAFCGLSVLFFALGVHSIWSIFRTSAHFEEDRFELREGSHVQSLRYDELTSVAVASWHIVCGRSEGKPLRVPTIFRGNALILARLQSILERRPNQ